MELKRITANHKQSDSAEEDPRHPAPKEKDDQPDTTAEGGDSLNEENSLLFQTNGYGDPNDDKNNDVDHIDQDARKKSIFNTTGFTPNQESTHWHSHCHALNAYIQQHGHPPRTRDENPSLYDWLQLLKGNQIHIERIFNSCLSSRYLQYILAKIKDSINCFSQS